jgi:hypothetical protein
MPQKRMFKLGSRLRPPQKRSKKIVRSRPKLMAAPAAISQQIVTAPPTFSQMPSGGVVIRHRENVGFVTVPSVTFGTFNNTAFSMNPGLVTSFPWLSAIAQNFEQYEFLDFSVEYCSRMPTSTAGAVAIAMDYDAIDIPAVTFQGLMANPGAFRSSAWNSFVFHASPGDLQRFRAQRYVRTGAIPAASDLKTYDVGTLQIATDGFAAPGVIGELYFAYTVRLVTPQFAEHREIEAQSLHLSSKTIGQANVTPFGSFPDIYGTLPVTVGGGNRIEFSTPGHYFVLYTEVGPTANALNMAGSTATVAMGAMLANTGDTVAWTMIQVVVTESGQGITFNTGTPTPSAVDSSVNVRVYPADDFQLSLSLLLPYWCSSR